MVEAFVLSNGRFIRLGEKRNFSEEKLFQKVFKGIIRISFQVFLGLLILFIMHELYIEIIEDPFFIVKEIDVKGCERLNPAEIISTAKIEWSSNILKLNLKEMARRLEHNPWIEEVSIRKVFPDKILIQIKERHPLAIIQLEDFYYIDSNGVIFSPVGDKDRYNFPILTGFKNKTNQLAEDLILKGIEFLKIAEQMKAIPLDEISEIHVDRDFGISCISMNEGIEVRIGWGNYEEKLKRLSLIWSDIKKRGMSPILIDCADLGRFIVKKDNKTGK